MSRALRSATLVSAWLLSLLLAACGGGDNSAPTPLLSSAPPATEIGAPLATGDTVIDTFNWFNFRRQQAGVPSVARNSALDAAAQGHSNYQQLNLIITHTQRIGNPGFTGATIADRLQAAGYLLTAPWAYGEVLVATGNPLGSSVAEALLVAIYHRFIVLEPRFKDVGMGAAAASNGYTYVTADFAANNGLGPALAGGGVIVYPFQNQSQVPPIFYSDLESPDPVADRNAVGYPVSIQAGLNAALTVSSFTIAARGQVPLAVQLLTNALDPNTPASAAAIIPLQVLTAATIYDVQFVGSADGQPVNRSWSFTTR